MSETPDFPAVSPPRRIAIFRALQLGDMLCSVPALRALKRAWPHAIQMHGSGGPANDIVKQWGAAAYAGFRQSHERPEPGFIAWPDDLPEPHRYLALVRALGIDADDDALWFPPTRGGRRENAEHGHRLGQRYAALGAARQRASPRVGRLSALPSLRISRLSLRAPLRAQYHVSSVVDAALDQLAYRANAHPAWEAVLHARTPHSAKESRHAI